MGNAWSFPGFISRTGQQEFNPVFEAIPGKNKHDAIETSSLQHPETLNSHLFINALCTTGRMSSASFTCPAGLG